MNLSRRRRQIDGSSGPLAVRHIHNQRIHSKSNNHIKQPPKEPFGLKSFSEREPTTEYSIDLVVQPALRVKVWSE